MLNNIWLKNSFKNFWTFEVVTGDDTTLVAEIKVEIDENPTMKVIESLEVEENGKKVWKPVLIIWEKFEVVFDESYLNHHNHIRLLEANGDTVGILRHYDKSGEYLESWVMYGLNLLDVEFQALSLKAVFDFHHALYLV